MPEISYLNEDRNVGMIRNRYKNPIRKRGIFVQIGGITKAKHHRADEKVKD